MGSDRFVQLSEGHYFAEVQIFIFIILNDPRENGVLREVVERSVSDEVQVKEVVTVGEHATLPGVLVILNLVKQVIINILAHLQKRVYRFLRIFWLLEFKNVFLASLSHNP